MPDAVPLLPDGLGDKYEINELLSVGGMAAVYAGTHVLLRKRVAIKVLRPELVGVAEMVGRFQREAIAASSIGHENIVAVTDMGVTTKGVAFLVMELLEGRNLHRAIKDEAPFALTRACDLMHGILAGLGAAHRAGIVHRDIKPGNVFLAVQPSGREVVKILDFGISSIVSSREKDLQLTSTGTVLGTPLYMAPEQARGERELGPTADIYAVGVLLHEMLSGQIPYHANNVNVLVHKILSGEHVPLSEQRPDVPRALEAAVAKAMALKPQDRFQSCEELDRVLAPFCSDEDQSSSSHAVSPVPAGDVHPRLTDQRIRAFAAGAFGTIAACLAAYFLVFAPGPPTSLGPAPMPLPAYAGPGPADAPSPTIEPDAAPSEAAVTVNGKPQGTRFEGPPERKRRGRPSGSERPSDRRPDELPDDLITDNPYQP